MPNCFALKKKGADKASKLVDVDQEIADMLGVECDPKMWTRSWYDIIGYGYALGRSFKETGEQMDKYLMHEPDSELYADLKKINEYLEKEYDLDSWYEMK